jgi:hypothetical protein
MDNAVGNGIIAPEIKPEQNKIVKYIIIAVVVIAIIYLAKRFIFKSA